MGERWGGTEGLKREKSRLWRSEKIGGGDVVVRLDGAKFRGLRLGVGTRLRCGIGASSVAEVNVEYFFVDTDF